ncbi:hypothetical protein ACXR0O_02275 [Verrucomicrobiota bacterium sgz303538]
MKLGKEEIQKIVLGVLLLLVLIYGYFEMLLGPLKKKRLGTQQRTAELTKQITEARTQIRRSQEIEASVPPSELVVKQVKAMIPEGAPVAWFPPQVAEHFKRQGEDKAATRLVSEQPEKDLPGFRRMAWTIDLPKVEFLPFAQTLADFENTEPLVEIASIQIEANREDAEFQRAFLNIRNVVTQ